MLLLLLAGTLYVDSRVRAPLEVSRHELCGIRVGDLFLRTRQGGDVHWRPIDEGLLPHDIVWRSCDGTDDRLVVAEIHVGRVSRVTAMSPCFLDGTDPVAAWRTWIKTATAKDPVAKAHAWMKELGSELEAAGWQRNEVPPFEVGRHPTPGRRAYYRWGQELLVSLEPDEQRPERSTTSQAATTCTYVATCTPTFIWGARDKSAGCSSL